MNKFTFSLLLAFGLLLSCNRVDSKLLYGQWQEIGTGNNIYVFDEDGNYTIDYIDDIADEERDKGTYEVQKNIIITKSEISTGQESYRIKLLEENKMILAQDDVFEITFIRTK